MADQEQGSGTSPINTEKLFAPEEIVSDLPTQEQITKEIEGDKSSGSGTDDKNKNPNPPVTPQPGDVDFTKIQDGHYWEYLHKELSDGDNKYSIPEEIITGKKKDGTALTNEDRFNILVGEIQKNSETGPAFDSHDAFVLRYQVAKLQKDFNYSEFLKQEAQTVEYLNMPARQYYEEVLKSQLDEKKERKYTDDQIKTHLDAKDVIKMEEEVKGMKANYISYLQKRDADMMKSVHGDVSSQFEKDEADNQKVIADYVTKNKTNRNFLGVELSEADHVEFLKELPEYIKRNPQTGHNKFEDFMLSNENFSQLMPFLWLQSKGKLSTYLSLIKEQTKEKIEGKLGSGDQNHGGGSGTGDPVNKNNLYKGQPGH